MSATEPLDELIARLDRAAEQLRSGELSPDAAATMVEDCAALATQAASELERLARAEPAVGEGTRQEAFQIESALGPNPGQDSLL